MLLALAAVAAPALSPAQSISTISTLSFGSFVAGSGGTLSISAGGARTPSGGVVGVGQSSTYSAASFRVSGTANATYTITLPDNGTVFLSDGVHTMALNNFVSAPPSGLLSGGGAQIFQVGATLTVGAGQPAGNYIGTFSITVNY